MPKYLEVFKVPISVHLDPVQQDVANRAINMKFLGRPLLLSLEETVSKEHLAAAYALCRHYTIYVDVGLLPDGRLEMINHDRPEKTVARKTSSATSRPGRARKRKQDR